MKKHLKTDLLVVLSALGLFLLAALPSRAEAPATSATVVRHFVAFQYKEGTTPEEIAKIDTAFLALKDQIPLIVSIERGTNNSPENRNHGFTDGFLLTFRTTADRDAYLVHPAHLAFVKAATPKFADAFVFDYTTPAAGGDLPSTGGVESASLGMRIPGKVQSVHLTNEDSAATVVVIWDPVNVAGAPRSLPAIQVWLLKADGTSVAQTAKPYEEAGQMTSMTPSSRFFFDPVGAAQAVAIALRADDELLVKSLRPKAK
jgi:hypothetical protein